MIELPEAVTLAKQAKETLTSKTIVEVINANSPHKFTFFHGDPLLYGKLLKGKQIQDTNGKGIFVDFKLNDNTCITIGEGVIVRYGNQSTKLPDKYQLLLGFDDGSHLVFTVAMYGSISAYQGQFESKYYKLSMESISPLSDAFNEAYFDKLVAGAKKNISAKGLLATEQRIPGIGNGALQDILFNAGVHPKRKLATLTDNDKHKLFTSLKHTLNDMTVKGGRDTETDLFGNNGGYKTILSKNTYKHPCPVCGDAIVKEAYLGGSVYYCPSCQPL